MKKLWPTLLTCGLLVGCATSSDVANIQTQIDELNSSVVVVSNNAAAAKKTATEAKVATQELENTFSKLIKRIQ